MRTEIRTCKYCNSKPYGDQEKPGMYGYKIRYECGSLVVVDYGEEPEYDDSVDTFYIEGCESYKKAQLRVNKIESILK